MTTAAILGLIGSAITAAAGIWKLFSSDSAAENTPQMQASAEAQQQADFDAKATQAHAKGDLDEIRDLESE
ncbi:MAG: hypothetical protein LV481_16015 [Methylacidiphilales bacterium]|nr:hypothetical protein [Candidatus Methylacidiphilales bacterium]